MAGEVPVHKKKPKKPQQRVYDQDGYKLRVDCVCFKDNTKQEVLMVSSRNSDGCWTMPGGGLDPGDETNEKAALREANEEAGIVGSIDAFIGTDVNVEKKIRSFGFSIIVTGENSVWEDKDDDAFINGGRERRWFSVPEACRILSERGKINKVKYFTNLSQIGFKSNGACSGSMDNKIVNNFNDYNPVMEV